MGMFRPLLLFLENFFRNKCKETEYLTMISHQIVYLLNQLFLMFGPISFLTRINDLSMNKKSKVTLFPDDTYLFSKLYDLSVLL